MPRPPARHDYDGWVAELGRASRRKSARQHLLAHGRESLPAIRRGVRHANPMVRRMCVRLLDNLVDEDSIPDLIEALDDPDKEVRQAALHALACDTCKAGECRPGDELFVPKALALLRHDPDPDMRASAIDALGRVAKRRADVVEALLEAADGDRHPGVRNIASRKVRRQLVARGLPD